MLVLISPAKTLDFESKIDKKILASKPIFLEEVAELVDILKKYSADDISSLMSVSKKLGELNFTRFQSFEKLEKRPALFAYKGDVYEGFELEKYQTEDIEFVNQTIRIISGLYGILKPLDEISPYRLEMSTALANKKGKNLYLFWLNNLTSYLNEEEPSCIINLASNEYFSALGQLRAKVINIVFKDQGKVIGIYAKKARGLMANYIVQNRINNPEDIKSFNLAGYNFVAAASSEVEYVFAR